jgi:DNA-binding transcriptional ArsR family regulator
MRRGYAHRLADDTDLQQQLAALEAWGCTEILVEREGGAPALQRLDAYLHGLSAGDELAAPRFDVFGRGAGRLVVVLNRLVAKGVAVPVLEPPVTLGPSAAPSACDLLALLALHEDLRVDPRALRAGPVGERPFEIARPARGGPSPPARPAVDWKQAVAFLGALAHPGRSAVFRLLLEAGEAGVSTGELTGALRMTGSALTFHLRVLADAELIRAQPAARRARDGRATLLTADFEKVEGLIALLRSGRGVASPEAERIGGPQPQGR